MGGIGRNDDDFTLTPDADEGQPAIFEAEAVEDDAPDRELLLRQMVLQEIETQLNQQAHVPGQEVVHGELVEEDDSSDKGGCNFGTVVIDAPSLCLRQFCLYWLQSLARRWSLSFLFARVTRMTKKVMAALSEALEQRHRQPQCQRRLLLLHHQQRHLLRRFYQQRHRRYQHQQNRGPLFVQLGGRTILARVHWQQYQ